MGTRSIEHVKQVAPNGRKWFQLYTWKDRERSMELADRAAKAGFDTLVVTADVPVAGAKLRDRRNGFAIPLLSHLEPSSTPFQGPGGGLMFSRLTPRNLRHCLPGMARSPNFLITCSIPRSPITI